MGWQPIASAPKDGTPVLARIPGHGEDNVIAYHYIGDCGEPEGGDAYGWTFVTEQEPPDDWTDGWCWAVNDAGVPSTQPTHWKQAEATTPAPGSAVDTKAEGRSAPQSPPIPTVAAKEAHPGEQAEGENNG